MQELDPVFDKVARSFSLLSDASRLKVIHAVCNAEQSVSDVMTATGLSQSAVSRHVTNLHLSGVASRRKAGAQALYQISDATLTEICRTACVSLMARESDELAAASALRESAGQFMAARLLHPGGEGWGEGRGGRKRASLSKHPQPPPPAFAGAGSTPRGRGGRAAMKTSP